MMAYSEEWTKKRVEYMKQLASDFGIPLHVVMTLADMLGPNEDHDGLVTELEDYADGGYAMGFLG